jgi:hypothetical protein
VAPGTPSGTPRRPLIHGGVSPTLALPTRRGHSRAVTHEEQASEWLATVKDRALTRAKAEAAGEGTQFSLEQLELVGVGILAGASEMVDVLDELGLLRRSH